MASGQQKEWTTNFKAINGIYVFHLKLTPPQKNQLTKSPGQCSQEVFTGQKTRLFEVPETLVLISQSLLNCSSSLHSVFFSFSSDSEPIQNNPHGTVELGLMCFLVTVLGEELQVRCCSNAVLPALRDLLLGGTGARKLHTSANCV